MQNMAAATAARVPRCRVCADPASALAGPGCRSLDSEIHLV